MIPSRVTLVDVGPRDGLQNEKQPVDAAVKIELVQRLQDAGLREIEVTSFVSPKWVPQMADNAAVMAGIERRPGVRYSVLMPNMKGLEAALSAPRARWPDEIVVFAAATEAFSQKNINCSIAESIERFAPGRRCRARARASRCAARCRCALGCPYQGEVSADEVERVVALHQGDRRRPLRRRRHHRRRHAASASRRRWSARCRHYPLDDVSGHFHDTYGQALGNVYASLEVGIATFDASVAGLGGCPYAKGATGNVATEDVLFMLRRARHRHRHVDRRRRRRGGVHLGGARQEAGLAGGQRAAREANAGVGSNR